MGFAQGVQAGTQAASFWSGGNRAKSNPYQAMGAIDATLKQLNKRLHPAMIRNTAAGMANNQKAIELQERKQDFIESQAAIAQREREDQRRWDAENKVADELNQQAGLESKVSPGEEYREGMGEIRTQEKHEWGMSKAKQAEDFKMVQWAVANRKAGPIVEFINQYGDKSANLRGISWNEKGEVLVFPENEQEQPGYFKNNEELMKSFVGFLNPKVEAQALKLAGDAAGEKRKDREQDRKDYATYNKKDVTPAQLRQLRNDSRKRYAKKFENVLGEVKEDAPDQEKWINEDVAKEIGAMGGPGEGAISEHTEPGGPGGGVKRYKDAKTGNTLVIHPGGKREVLDPSGKVLATKGGEKKDQPGEQLQWDEAIDVAAKADKAEKEAKVPPKEKAKARAHGTATYTDPKTGKKMKATMASDGTITTEEVGTEKKKRKEGYGKQGYKPKSINK